MTLRKHGDHDEDDLASPWTATVGFTYLSDGSGGLEAALEGMGIHERQPVLTKSRQKMVDLNWRAMNWMMPFALQ